MGNYASTSKLKPLNATGSLKLSNFIADPRKLKANFASTTAPGGDIFAVGECADKMLPKTSKASDGRFRTGGILKTLQSHASQDSFQADEVRCRVSDSVPEISVTSDHTDSMVKSMSSNSLGYDCSKPGCVLNEREIVRQNDYI